MYIWEPVQEPIVWGSIRAEGATGYEYPWLEVSQSEEGWHALACRYEDDALVVIDESVHDHLDEAKEWLMRYDNRTDVSMDEFDDENSQAFWDAMLREAAEEDNPFK